jgi:RNA polymerase sigma factor (sigma-70 family)
LLRATETTTPEDRANYGNRCQSADSSSIPFDASDLEAFENAALFEAWQQHTAKHSTFESFARLTTWRSMIACVDAFQATREVSLKAARGKIKRISPENAVFGREQTARLESAVETLPKRLRDLVFVLYKEGVPQREIARHWSITESTISQLNDLAIRRINANHKSETRATHAVTISHTRS